METFFGQEVGLVKIPLTRALLLSTSQNFSYTSIPEKKKEMDKSESVPADRSTDMELAFKPAIGLYLLIITCRGTGLRWPVTLK